MEYIVLAFFLILVTLVCIGFIGVSVVHRLARILDALEKITPQTKCSKCGCGNIPKKKPSSSEYLE